MSENKYNLRIAEEAFFNNGEIILKSIPDIEEEIRKALNSNISVTTVTRDIKGKNSFEGISAIHLNKVLREKLSVIEGMNGETHVKNGIFFPVSKEGFDFSLYDRDYNFSRLYNYYIGSKGILYGDRKIIDDLSVKEMGMPKREWRKKIEEIELEVGINNDYLIHKQSLTVVGEIQFGNWALAYRDIIRLLNANISPGIDFYIYITSTGELSKKLSENTVDFKRIKEIYNDNSSLVQIPSWIIGLDI